MGDELVTDIKHKKVSASLFFYFLWHTQLYHGTPFFKSAHCCYMCVNLYFKRQIGYKNNVTYIPVMPENLPHIFPSFYPV